MSRSQAGGTQDVTWVPQALAVAHRTDFAKPRMGARRPSGSSHKWSRQDRMTWGRVVTEDTERNEEIQDLFERKERDRKITDNA